MPTTASRAQSARTSALHSGASTCRAALSCGLQVEKTPGAPQSTASLASVEPPSPSCLLPVSRVESGPTRGGRVREAELSFTSRCFPGSHAFLLRQGTPACPPASTEWPAWHPAGSRGRRTGQSVESSPSSPECKFRSGGTLFHRHLVKMECFSCWEYT